VLTIRLDRRRGVAEASSVSAPGLLCRFTVIRVWLALSAEQSVEQLPYQFLYRSHVSLFRSDKEMKRKWFRGEQRRKGLRNSLEQSRGESCKVEGER
jgi:hypothetical protein